MFNENERSLLIKIVTEKMEKPKPSPTELTDLESILRKVTNLPYQQPERKSASSRFCLQSPS